MEEFSATSLVAIIIALGTSIAGIITALRTRQDASIIKHDVKGLNTGLEQVHVAVNTNYQKMESKLEVAVAKITALENAAAEAETTRAVLAAEAVKHALPPDVARAVEALLAAQRAIVTPVPPPQEAMQVIIPEIVVPVEAKPADDAPRIIKP